MSLPPVVSDPKRCSVRHVDLEDIGYDPDEVLRVLGEILPHIWEPVQTARGSSSEVCRFCGGRKP